MERYRFGDFQVDPARVEIRAEGRTIHVEPQVFNVILHLLQHRHRVVTKAELLDNVWGDRFVSDSALASRITAARKALGDDGRNQAVIRTVFGTGYQFVAEIDGSAQDPVTVEPPGPTQDEEVIRFVTVPGGTRLAYAVSGTGPVLVKAANWMTHLELDRESPVWRHWTDELSARYTLVRYDERGCGLSDWDVEDFSFSTWVEDLGCVVDDAGLDRFPLLGISQGAAVAIEFAARYPDRVTGLVLVGAYPRGRLVRAVTEADHRAAALDMDLARAGWGVDGSSFMQVFASQFIPDGTRRQWDDFNALQARTTSAANAVRFLETFAAIDVTDAATRVRCPTLLVHSRDEVRVPAENAREIASLIPGAELVTLPSRNHLLQAGEPAWQRFLATAERFLSGLG